MQKDSLNMVRDDVEHALRNISKLIHPVIWSRLNDLSQEIDNQIEDEANLD